MVFLYHSFCVECLKVLATASRLHIFRFLKNNSQLVTISMLVEYLRLKQPTVTFHVNKLVEYGLVRKLTKGRNSYCEISKKCDDCPLFH